MKVKLFTHTDLDGVGCAVLAKKAYGEDNVDVSYCNYDKVDELVCKFITRDIYLDYDLVLITDISVNEEVAELIDSTINKVDVISDGTPMIRKLILLDHHNTAAWLNKYWWANVSSVKVLEDSGGSDEDFMVVDTIKTSGTSMLFDYLTQYFDTDVLTYELYDFAETVRRYDTWDWFNVFGGDLKPKRLNNLLYLIGRGEFLDRFVNSPSTEFTDGEKLLLRVEEDRIDTYISKVGKTLKVVSIKGYTAGVVYAEQYQSELGNELALNNTDLDFIAIVNLGGGAISFRGVKNDIDLGVLAQSFGGGGHAKAAGAQLTDMVTIATNTLIFGWGK